MLRLMLGALIAMTMVFGPLAAMAADLKIGVCDPDAIGMSSAEGKRVQEAIKKKMEELSRPFNTKGQDLDHQVQEYQKQAGTMKEDARKRKEDELNKKFQEIQKQKADAEKQLNQFKESQLTPMIKKMDQALEQVAKEEKLDMIIQSRAVAYLGNKALDVTEKVRAKFGR